MKIVQRVGSRLTLDPFGIILNSFALGDIIAAVPVVKWIVENHYGVGEYRLVVKGHFRCLFPFVPDEYYRDFDSTDEVLWGIPSDWPLCMLNRKVDGRFVRLTPKHMTLGQYAGINLLGRILSESELRYVGLDSVDVSRFGDMSRSVIIVCTYRDHSRSWPIEEMMRFAGMVVDRGLVPVFVGKTDMDADIKPGQEPKDVLPAAIGIGIDLRNKTTISELASIMSGSVAVCGIDSGPIHLAGTTNVPIICGYTSVMSELRVPNREGKTYALDADIECAGCESKWHASGWNFANCFYGHTNCIKTFSAERFAEKLDIIIGG